MVTETNLHTAGSLEARETHAVIGSDKVEGTAVYRSTATRLDTLHGL
jgi:hypothetical protein